MKRKGLDSDYDDDDDGAGVGVGVGVGVNKRNKLINDYENDNFKFNKPSPPPSTKAKNDIKFADHLDFLNEMTNGIQKAQTTHLERIMTKGIVEAFFDDLNRRSNEKNGVTANDDVIGTINKLIHNIDGYVFSGFQQEMMDEIFRMCSPILLRHLSDDKRLAILRKNNMLNPEQQLFFGKTSRRGGKTDTLTACAALFLIFVMELKMLYYSLYEDTCKVACATVISWLEKLGFQRYRDFTSSALEIKFLKTGSKIMFLTSQIPNVSIYIIIFLLFYYYIFRQQRERERERERDRKKNKSNCKFYI